MRCYVCEYHLMNNSLTPRIIRGKLLKPGHEYCGQGKMTKIGRRDIDVKHGHPVWCPLYNEAATCIVCGSVIYGDEGDACKSCRRKGLY